MSIRSDGLRKPFGESPLRKPLEPTPIPSPIEPQRVIQYSPDETQRLLREILAKLDAIEKRLSNMEKILSAKQIT